jgi:hypothetical protein
MTKAQDAELRAQIVGSCLLMNRHTEGLIRDIAAILTMPDYKTECEDSINRTERALKMALRAIELAKKELGKKELETT